MRILIIDDDVDIVETMQFLLSTKGHDVFSAFDGAEGLDEFANCNPELIFLDLKMPKMNGIMFLKKISKLQTNVKIIVMSAFEINFKKIQSYNNNVIKIIEKPFPLSTLENMVNVN